MTIEDLKQNMSKFSFAELTSSSDGKTSPSATMGCLIVVTGCIGFILGIVSKIQTGNTGEILMYSVAVITAGSALLTANRLGKPNSMVDECVKLDKANRDDKKGS